MTTPYRSPDVPPEVGAEERLDARVAEITEAFSARAAEEERRRSRRKRMLTVASVVCFVYAVVALVLRLTYADSGLLALSAYAAGLVSFLTLVTRIGLKVRPQEGNPGAGGVQVPPGGF